MYEHLQTKLTFIMALKTRQKFLRTNSDPLTPSESESE